MSLLHDVRIGSQRPRVSSLPSNRSGSAGSDAVDLAATAGLILDDWQSWCLDMAMGEDPDRQWSAFEVAIIVSRQCGKGSILEARQLAGLFLLGERLQVHTAHEFKTCFEHFLRMVNLVESAPDLDKRVQRVRRGAGEQSIELRNGNRLRFLARSGGSGRGMSGDVVYLDEAYALTSPMMGALLPTLSARPNPQVWYTSSAPKSTSEVLAQVRKRGHEGNSPRLFFAEWGHERGVDIYDRDNWYIANPALGIRVSEEFIEAELAAMESMPEEFARERLGVPDPDPSEARPVKLPAAAWAATVGPDLPATESPTVLTFDVSRDGEWSTVAIAAGTMSSPYVEVIAHRQGVGWLPSFLVDKVRSIGPVVVGVNGAGPAGAQVGPVLAAFADAGIDASLLKQLSTTEYKQACGGFYTDVTEGRLRRPEQGFDGKRSPLDIAASDATERPLGDAWAWDFRNATVPISPLVAVTVARSLLPAKESPAPVFIY
jgi:hypothetical protein